MADVTMGGRLTLRKGKNSRQHKPVQSYEVTVLGYGGPDTGWGGTSLQ